MTHLTILIITVILSFALLIFIFEITLQKRQADINLLQKELFDLENKHRLSLKSNILITKDNEYLISQVKKQKDITNFMCDRNLYLESLNNKGVNQIFETSDIVKKERLKEAYTNLVNILKTL